MKSLFKYECYETGFAELPEKVTLFKKHLVLKMYFFGKSSCSEEAPSLKKYMSWIVTYSGEKALQK